MLYIIILTIATSVIVLYSKNIYSKVNVYTSNFEEIEIAMSYVNVKVRQNDKSGVISVKNIDNTGNTALVLTNNDMSIWIFEYNDMLIETKSKVGIQPDLENYIEIAEITDFDVQLNDKLLEYEVKINNEFIETSAINLRADN